jgi:hypothetical protein
MNIKTLKNIMKEVNEPNEFDMTPHDLVHPLYWIWKVENCRIKTLDSRLSTKRKEENRFDVFVWGGYIAPRDYNYEQIGNDFYIKFIRANFPATIENPNDPDYGQPWSFEVDDEVKIEGDLERVI